MEKIDITITATLRQKIFYKTLLSFTKNMLTDQSRYRIILNVDPIGEDNTQQKMLDVAKGFFRDIVYRFPDKPCFSVRAGETYARNCRFVCRPANSYCRSICVLQPWAMSYQKIIIVNAL